MIETDEHQLFRKTLRDLFEREIEPHVDEWEAARTFPAHELFPKLAAVGLLGLEYDEAYGGMGADHSFTVIAGEEMGRIGCGGVPDGHGRADVDGHAGAGTATARDELKDRYLAPAVRGEMVTSIAVTEPDAGSDVAGIRTRAVRDGDEWVINGAKLYITNGTQADWLCLLARTSDDGGYRGMSLIVVPTALPGVAVSRKLEKLGMWSSDTAELSFTDVRVPGVEHHRRDRARLPAADGAVPGRAADHRLQAGRLHRAGPGAHPGLPARAPGLRAAAAGQPAPPVRPGRAVGPPRHAQALRLRRRRGRARAARTPPASPPSASCSARGSSARWRTRGLQFHGGIGYMAEHWTSRFFRDTRLDSIGAGADEVMLRILARMDGYTAD